MQPAFKNAVGKLARVAAFAVSAPVIRTHLAGVLILQGVATAGLLAGMGEGTVGPVVTSASGASPDLEFVHTELIGGIWVFVGKHVGGGLSASE